MRLIDADALQKATIMNPIHVPYVTKNDIERAPNIDAVPVVHGRWIEPVPGDGFPYCSNCKNIALDKGLFLNPKLMDWNLTPYCPHCGAKMDGGTNDA